MLVRHRASIAKSLTLRANRTCPVGLACSVESGTGLRAGNGERASATRVVEDVRRAVHTARIEFRPEAGCYQYTYMLGSPHRFAFRSSLIPMRRCEPPFFSL